MIHPPYVCRNHFIGQENGQIMCACHSIGYQYDNSLLIILACQYILDSGYINQMDQQQKPAPQSLQPNQEVDINNMAMSSVPSFQSINSMNAEIKDSKVEEEEGEDLQIVQNKSDKRINHEEILKMFNEQIEKEEKERQEIELKRRESMKNKSKVQQKPVPKKISNQEKKFNKENNNEALLKALTQKSGRIKKRIEDHCKQYKSMYRPSIYDTKMQKFRFECKQKLFFYLCYGFEELRELLKEQLSEVEQQIITKNCYDVCRKLTFEIDLQMVKTLNKNDKQDISREYRQQFETLINNIKDENNYELKRKILNRTLPPSRIAVANQIEFFTTQKREEILEKQKRYIAEFTVQNVMKPFKEEEPEEILERPRAEEGPKEEIPVLTPLKSGVSNKYLEQSSILQLQELLSESQLNKMLNRLQEDLQGQSRTTLINNFKEVFSM